MNVLPTLVSFTFLTTVTVASQLLQFIPSHVLYSAVLCRHVYLSIFAFPLTPGWLRNLDQALSPAHHQVKEQRASSWLEEEEAERLGYKFEPQALFTRQCSWVNMTKYFMGWAFRLDDDNVFWTWKRKKVKLPSRVEILKTSAPIVMTCGGHGGHHYTGWRTACQTCSNWLWSAHVSHCH